MLIKDRDEVSISRLGMDRGEMGLRSVLERNCISHQMESDAEGGKTVKFIECINYHGR